MGSKLKGSSVAKTTKGRRTAERYVKRYVVAKPDGSFSPVRVKASYGVAKSLGGKKKTRKKFRSGSSGGVYKLRVQGADERLTTVYAIDFASATFGSDLGYAFKKNVAKARRENRKKVGAADAVVHKG